MPRPSPSEMEVRLQDFLRYLEQERGVSANTVTAYGYALRGYLRHLEAARTKPSRMTREAVLAYIQGQGRRSLGYIAPVLDEGIMVQKTRICKGRQERHGRPDVETLLPRGPATPLDQRKEAASNGPRQGGCIVLRLWLVYGPKPCL